MKAYSYSRYSSDAQKHGTSIDRQQTLARKWCKDNGIDLSDRVFADEAVSGFHGDNVRTGALGEFIAARESGEIEPGSILILEHLDRLTRLKPMQAVSLLSSITELDITVVTLRPEMKFTKEWDTMQLLQAVLHLDNAHKESARKSDLGKIEWGKRFARARQSGHHIGKRVSNWLDLGEDGKYHLNGHADAVREIFRLCLEGLGSTAISQALNAKGYKTFNKGGRWGTTAVLTILQNRAAIGELAPKDGGEPIPNYFPAVVDQDTFDSAKSIIKARQTGKIPKQSAEFNVWGKLVFCGACGSAMHIIQRTKFRYLMCANRRYGSCEGSKNVRLDESEDVLMALLMQLDAISLVMPDPDKLHRELTAAEGRLITEREKLAVWAGKLAFHPESETFANFVLQSEARIKTLKAEVERLTADLTGGQKLNWSEIRARIDLTDKNTRRRINAFLHRLHVQVRIAEGYLVIQGDEGRAIFAVSKGKIGHTTLHADKGIFPNLMQTNAMALGVKNRLVKHGMGYSGKLTVPNGRGTRRTTKGETRAVQPAKPVDTGPATPYDTMLPDEAYDLLDEHGKPIFSPDTYRDEYSIPGENGKFSQYTDEDQVLHAPDD
ncbi:recombinase family protein [Herbaspirillum sp. SJZ107]|uniref:recombinase family protein n=1 Tax=Herbaspirillum sp. SJZ107 TaxID=2572881 RepID=UPI00114E105E|nr:recombinase family protein [Herbaspirillum sp. SJZ107]TQK07008.1 DNA invertase Pin-like site-specific DNA recombinase [Herbaspirillum sp. SJZ107]